MGQGHGGKGMPATVPGNMLSDPGIFHPLINMQLCRGVIKQAKYFSFSTIDLPLKGDDLLSILAEIDPYWGFFGD